MVAYCGLQKLGQIDSARDLRQHLFLSRPTSTWTPLSSLLKPQVTGQEKDVLVRSVGPSLEDP